MIQVLKSKIHRACVTGADLHYEGSVSIAPHLMEAAQIFENELVHVWNITNRNRIQTYAISGKPNLEIPEVKLNGSVAHRFKAGDFVIITSFRFISESDVYFPEYKPKILLMNPDTNKYEIK